MFRLALLALLLAGNVHAQAFPTKSIRIVVPWPPGGVTDVLTRAVAAQMGESLGQQVLVENRPGAGGTIGVGAVAKAPADGYTLVMTDVPSHAISATLYPKLAYDVMRDFESIAMVAGSPMVLATHPALNAKDLRAFLQAARARPGQLSYASSGIGTTTHLSMERIKMSAKVDITHVPYQPAQAVGAAVAGHTQISSTSMPPAVSHARAGRVRAIAVTSAQRSPALPDVPTVNEQGFSGFDDLTWTAFFAPAAVPQDLVNRLNSEITRALSAPDVRERLSQLGLDWRSNTPGEFAAFLRDEVRKWSRAVKDSGATAD